VASGIPLAHKSLKKIKGQNMEQAIQAVFAVKAESKAFNSADPAKMVGAAISKGKIQNNQSAKEDDDVKTPVVPFIQILNQKISQTDKSADTTASDASGEKITLQQAMLLLQADATAEELQKALENLIQSAATDKVGEKSDGQPGFTIDALLKEIDLVKKNMASGDIKAEPDVKPDIITSLVDNELKTVTSPSDNFQEIISDKNIGGNQSGAITAQSLPDAGLAAEESPKATSMEIAGMDLKNVTGTKSGQEQAKNLNFQSQPDEETADSEIKFAAPEKEKQTILKTDEKTLQPEKMIFKDAQLSASTVSKITVNLMPVKEENKISKDIPPSESAKEDSGIRNNSRLSTQETKESLVSKDNLRFAEVQYSNTAKANEFAEVQYSNAAKANEGNKAQAGTMQAILAEVSGPIKADQKGTTIVGQKGSEEISLTTVTAAGSGSAGTGKINDVSPDKIISQITSEIKEAAANDGGRVKITLNPPSLGKVEMDVTIRNGRVEVVLVADNKDVQQALNTHIDKLKGSLQTQGLTIERCDVFMQDKREEYQQSFSQHAFYNQDRSGQDNNSRRDNPEEEIKANAIIPERPVSVLRASTDNISLFA
jgi:flagellar hook-length control protein FliK